MQISHPPEVFTPGLARTYGHLPIPHGQFVERIQFSPSGELLIHGYAVLEEFPLTNVRAFYLGKEIASGPTLEWKDLTKVFPLVPHAAQGAYQLTAPTGSVPDDRTVRLELLFLQGDTPRAFISVLYRANLAQLLPSPPPELTRRVIGTDDHDFYHNFALSCMGFYMDALVTQRPLAQVSDLLDWGCGCGRVTQHYKAISSPIGVYGCDIDGETVGWASGNLPGIEFAQSEPFPPLPYPNESFDVVVSLSVLTHLTETLQLDWLEEVRRILRPGGMFLASVHGDSFIRRELKDKADIVLAKGFSDIRTDGALDGIAPENYYRATFQTEAYTRRIFNRLFDVVDYRVRGVGIQDLVVMRKGEPKGISDKLALTAQRLKSKVRR